MDPCNLLGELAKIRLLIAESTSPAMTRALIETAAKLTKEIDRQDTLRSRYLHSSAVHRFLEDVLAIIHDEMSVLPEDLQNKIVDAVYARIAAKGALNTHNEVKLISTDRK